jgi:hypothetical protein
MHSLITPFSQESNIWGCGSSPPLHICIFSNVNRHFQRWFELLLGNLCYTDNMQEDRSFWSSWAQFLQDKGASDLAITLLEAAGPLRILAAQFLYASLPFVGQSQTSKHWFALAGLLEDSRASQSFISFLRKEV